MDNGLIFWGKLFVSLKIKELFHVCKMSITKIINRLIVLIILIVSVLNTFK